VEGIHSDGDSRRTVKFSRWHIFFRNFVFGKLRAKTGTVRTYSTISLQELRKLVTDLFERDAGVSIRYRLVGEMWYHDFLKIIGVDECGIRLLDEGTDKEIYLPDLATIIQFELDSPFRFFEPHCPYTVLTGRQFVLV